MKITIFFILLFGWILSDPIVESDEERLERVRERFAAGYVLHAEMRHEFLDSYTGEKEVTEGEIWISNEKYRIKVIHQEVLVDGKLSRVYNEPQNKLLISEYVREEDDFAPSRFFSDEDQVFSVKSMWSENGVDYFELVPDDPFEIFKKVTLALDQDAVPVSIRAVDQMDNQISTIFIESGFIPDNSNVFTPDFPDSAEVVDLRN